eukprot:TRINITY_DN4400_c0_g1_i1.p1 TRINITY_DN4400_c0_g1~~TRINITY_DN4400_c0_g1_i1.p1  ORF type:complete len:204 (-),score=27.30 TRINITY_DN4400_c0_g1_i1:483-1094(-)
MLLRLSVGGPRASHWLKCRPSSTSTTPSVAKEAKPPNYWNDVATQKRLFDAIAVSMSISSPEQWYKIRLADIYKHGGGSVIRHYYGSNLARALAAVYPDHEWLPWRFPSVPRTIWLSMEMRNKFREYAMRQLRIATEADWAAVSAQQIAALGGRGLLQHYGGSIKVAMKSEMESADLFRQPSLTLKQSLQQALTTLHSEGSIY